MNVPTIFDPRTVLPEGWIRDYVLAHEGYDRVPPALHAFSIISAFGSMFGRRVRIMRGAEHAVDTTQSVVLVSPSGEGKGAAMRRARLTVEAAAPGFTVAGGKATMEGILVRFDPLDARGLVIADELGAMFGKQHFRANFDQEMTDFLDNKDTYQWHTKASMESEHGGEYRNVAATLLAGTTMDWMRRAMPGTALEEGFASRVLWIREVVEPRFLPLLPAGVPNWAPLCRELQAFWLERMKQPVAEFVLYDERLPEVKEWLMWYKTHFNALPKGDPWRRGWWNRRPSMYLQLALIFSIAETMRGPRLALSVEAMRGAARVLDWAEPGIQRIFDEMGRTNPLHELRVKVMSKLAQLGGAASETLLHRKVAYHTGSSENTHKTLTELQSAGMVRYIMLTEDGKTRAGWTLTDVGREMF